jgi:glucan 1,3-beta-glucosidase
MSAAYLRHPAVLLAAVSVAIALTWLALGRPAAMPRSPLAPNEKLDCLSYQPFRPGQSPFDEGIMISPAEIEADLARLAPHTGCLRTHTVAMGLDRLPEIARRHDIAVLQGIALGRDADKNRTEFEQALALARADRGAIRAFVVGSEVLSRGDLPAVALGRMIRDFRAQAKKPVTYADQWEIWLKAGELLDAVDFVTLHVRPYRERYPVAADEAALRVAEVRAKVAASFPGKEILIGETGWPSAGRMREAALPSPASQAQAIHELIAAAKAGGFQIVFHEAFEQPWKRRLEGTAGAYWGLFGADTRAFKFRWGGAVSNHPFWFFQGLIGLLLAYVTFAAGFLAARSLGPRQPRAVDWPPVAGIALAGGLFVGWALANAPLESSTALDWFNSIFLVLLALGAPPVAAAAAVRRAPFEGFAALFDPFARRAADPVAKAVTALLAFAVIAAITSALELVFDPHERDIPFAPLTGPAAALLLLAWTNPPGQRRESFAEISAALILGLSAVFILFNETFWNWQALWFAAVLLALAAACLRARGARNP